MPIETVVVETPELGDRSYLIHDGAVAAVIDPQRDIDRIGIDRPAGRCLGSLPDLPGAVHLPLPVRPSRWRAATTTRRACRAGPWSRW